MLNGAAIFPKNPALADYVCQSTWPRPGGSFYTAPPLTLESTSPLPLYHISCGQCISKLNE